MPAPAPAVPDPPRWMPGAAARRHRTDVMPDRVRRCRERGDQAAIAAPVKAASARSSPRARPARPARARTTCSATRRRGRSPRPETANRRPSRAVSIHRMSVAQRSCAEVPRVASGLTWRRTETLVSPRAYAARARAIAPAPYHRPRTRPQGPTSRTALQARHRYRRTRTRMLSGVSAASTGPRTCRSTTPWPTMTSRPPTGRPAASQQGHVPGRASAHVGIRAIQDLIPSELATNLWRLRISSMVREARRRGARPPKARPSPSLSFSFRAPPLQEPRGDGHHARLAGRPGDRLRLPPRHQAHHDAVQRVGGDEMAIMDEDQTRTTQRRLPGAVTRKTVHAPRPLRVQKRT